MGKRGGGISPAIANRRRKQVASGWHREAEAKRVGNFAYGVMPAGPTSWDRLVYALGLAGDEDAIELLQNSRLATDDCGVRRKVARLAKFVRVNYTRRFVPETVLDLMGLDPSDRSEFYRAVGNVERATAARWGDRRATA